jgi:hypothetical protein
MYGEKTVQTEHPDARKPESLAVQRRSPVRPGNQRAPETKENWPPCRPTEQTNLHGSQKKADEFGSVVEVRVTEKQGFFYRWVPRGIPRLPPLPLGYGNGTQR